MGKESLFRVRSTPAADEPAPLGGGQPQTTTDASSSTSMTASTSCANSHRQNRRRDRANTSSGAVWAASFIVRVGLALQHADAAERSDSVPDEEGDLGHPGPAIVNVVTEPRGAFVATARSRNFFSCASHAVCSACPGLAPSATEPMHDVGGG
jgi:hypothetical protein